MCQVFFHALRNIWIVAWTPPSPNNVVNKQHCYINLKYESDVTGKKTILICSDIWIVKSKFLFFTKTKFICQVDWDYNNKFVPFNKIIILLSIYQYLLYFPYIKFNIISEVIINKEWSKFTSCRHLSTIMGGPIVYSFSQFKFNHKRTIFLIYTWARMMTARKFSISFLG